MKVVKSDYKEDAERITAVFETNLGTFEAELYAKECPETVWNFINLTEGRQKTEKPGNFYDGLTFHRVIDGFMIQGGCPLGTGTGGPGYRFQDEFDPSLRHDIEGIISMANAGPATNGSQFFVTLGPTPHLNNMHSVFGKVVKGMDVVRKIGSVKTGPMDKPLEPVVMNSVIIQR
jgi:cyclophilin family peptidyl-prolyl cis-trans isomerase